MEALELQAQVREEKGKGSAAKFRRDGLLPCVLYGSEMDTMSLTVKAGELDRIIREGGHNALIKVKVDNQEYITLVKEVQSHPVTKDYLHADLQSISLKEKLQIFVPLQIIGDAPGVELGGILQQHLREIEVECLPTDIPEIIEVDISSLGFGDSLTVADLSVTEGVEIITEADTMMVSIVAPQAEEEEVEEDGLETEETLQEPARVGEEEDEE